MIRDVREQIAAELQTVPWPVHAYKPDDVGSVPCIVVDRPTVAVDVQHNVFTVPIVVIGLRDGSHEAQSELDDAASAVVRALTGPTFAVSRVEPSVASVAELTYPSYTLTVACGATYC